MTALRLAVVLAAPFPAPRGSQRLVQGQVRALEASGTDVVLFTHGAGDGREPRLSSWVQTPSLLASRHLGSGFYAGKPASDLALVWRLRREHRLAAFDAVIAHNAEAAVVALLAHQLGGPPVVYVAHTLWQQELASYLRPGLEARAAELGQWLDRWIARRAAACIALSPVAAAALSETSQAPVSTLPPGHDADPPPDEREIAQACALHGLSPGGFALYPGNLDRYQNLELLCAAAAEFGDAPVVAVTQDEPRQDLGNLRIVRVGSPEQSRSLIFGAGLVVVPRRAVGGFPIKLLESMEAGRAILALEGVAGSLEHGVSGWLVPPSVDGRSLAAAMRGLWRDPDLRRRLGLGARERLEAVHGWPAHAIGLRTVVEERVLAQPAPERSRTISCT